MASVHALCMESSHQSLINLFLYKTRHLALSIHINYMAIGLVLSELWIFEVQPEILGFPLGSMSCEGCNSPYKNPNWVQRILFES